MRNGVLLVVVVLGGVAAAAPAKTKKEEVIPKLFCNAQYVSVQTYEGAPDVYLARDYPSDYDAAVGVQNRIEGWGRYRLVYASSITQSVDLIFVVWKERATGNRLPGQPTEMPPVGGPREPGPGTGAPGQNPGQPGQPQRYPGQGPGVDDGPGNVGVTQGGGPGVGGVFPVDDQLAVYTMFDDQHTSAPLWKHSLKDGLKEPNMPLFRKFADAVDDACSDSK
jgi:hypothetical protein